MSISSRHFHWLIAAVCACVLSLPAAAAAQAPAPKPATGKATIVNGQAVAPPDAPPRVVKVIEAANRIARKPYRYGGGHAKFEDSGYDCSGAASYALHGGGLLASPMPSGPFTTWGKKGVGRWITVYANSGHMYLMVAGLRFDTGYRDPNAKRDGSAPGTGPRWGRTRPTSGFVARHPARL